MQTTGPITLAFEVPVTAIDPAEMGGNPSVAAQIQNSSIFVLSMLTAGDIYTIQPFTAQTIPLSGQPLIITPVQNPSGGSTGTQLMIVWLLEGESPPMTDGPLTAAAILASTQPSATNLGTFAFNSAATAPQVELINIPPNTQCLVVVVGGPLSVSPITFEIEGVTTGSFYWGPYGVNVVNNAPGFSTFSGPPCVVPFSGLLDAAAFMSFTVPPALAQYEITVYAVSELINPGPPGPVQSISVETGTGGAPVTVLDLGTGISGPVVLESISWTGLPVSGGVPGNLIFTDTGDGVVFFAPLIPAVTTPDENVVGGFHDFKQTVLPYYNGIGARKLTMVAPTGCYGACELSYLLLG